MLSLLTLLLVSSTTPLRDSAERIVATQTVGVQGFQGVRSGNARRESFLGPTNLVMGGLLFGSTIADVESSFSCFGTTSTRRTTLSNGDVLVETAYCYESNGFRVGDYGSGRGAVYPKNFAVNGAVWTGSYFLRRSKNPALRVLGWAGPIVVTGFQAGLALNNLHQRSIVSNFK